MDVNMEENNEKSFYRVAAMLLVLTAVAKLYSSGGSAKILYAQDQLLHLGYRPLIILAALVEICAATLLLKSRSDLNRSLVLLWLSANFICYHIGNYLLGIHYCPCLGQAADALPLPRGMPNIILQVLALYWFVGSLRTLWNLRGSRQWTHLALSFRGLFRKRLGTPHPY